MFSNAASSILYFSSDAISCNPMQSLCYTTLSGNVVILCMKKFDALKEDQELLEQNTFTQNNKKQQILYANIQQQMDFLPIL